MNDTPNDGSLEELRETLAARLMTLRHELYGEHGGPRLAHDLGLPAWTWHDCEAATTIPAEVLLRLVERTDVRPEWLLTGQGTMLPPFSPEFLKQMETVTQGGPEPGQP